MATQMQPREVVTIVTHGGYILWEPKGQLPDQRSTSSQEYRGEGPTAGCLPRQQGGVKFILTFRVPIISLQIFTWRQEELNNSVLDL